ncbi:MAG: hypothetical protein GC206_03105 [Alphaproteobacteria bacterium]|nr:hypothetical protein [Alphaproteobacteria bacterium]
MLFDFGLAIAATFAASVAACRLVMAADVEDGPFEPHKKHTIPTPTSAGLAIGFAFCIGVITLTYPPVRAWNETASASVAADLATSMIAIFLFLGIGTIDDLWPIPAKTKIVIFVFASLAPPLFSALRPESIPFGASLELPLPYIVAIVGAALWIFTLVNTVNFMDGAHGLSMGCTAIGLAALGCIAISDGRESTAAACFCGAAALAGFLVWNYPHGKLFAGDSGALFAGSLAAITSLLAVRNDGVSPFIPAILFLPLLADTLFTLAWRVLRGRDVLVGHREHFYQIGIRAEVGATRVTRRYWAASALCGVIAFAADHVGRVGLGITTGDAARDRLLGAVASYAQFAAFSGLLIAALVLNGRIRAYAKARGFDKE